MICDWWNLRAQMVTYWPGKGGLKTPIRSTVQERATYILQQISLGVHSHMLSNCLIILLTFFLQDVSGPFLYGTLNRRPQMTLPRPRSDRLGSETSSITNHIDLPVMTSSISAYNNNTGMSGQDIWTPMAVQHSHPGHGAQCGGGYQMPGTVGNGGPGNGSVASSLRSESPISSGKTFMLHR